MTNRGVMARTDFFERVYEVVKQIPHGQVATYGQVGLIVSGSPRAARTVGWALHGLPDERVEEVPWWRVINAQGRISNSRAHHGAVEQRRRLELEGVVFDDADRTDLSVYQWDGPVWNTNDDETGIGTASGVSHSSIQPSMIV